MLDPSSLNPGSCAFWSTFRFAAGEDYSRYVARLFTAGVGMIGQGYRTAPLSPAETNLYESGRLPCDFDCTSVAWTIRGGNATSRAALAQQATWQWNFGLTLISGSPLDTYMLPENPYLTQQLSREEAAELLTFLREERAGALHGVYRYTAEPYRISAGTTFAVHLNIGSWVPLEDTYVRFTLHGRLHG